MQRRRRTEFSDDRPISFKKQDKLARSGFARSLAERIRAWRGRDSLVLALTGEWGCGKSSVKNMILERLRSVKARGVDILEFNPWQFSGHSSLSEAFFQELARQMGREGTDISEQRAKRLRSYAKLLSFGVSATKSVASLVRAINGDDVSAISAPVVAAGEQATGVLNSAAEVQEARAKETGSVIELKKTLVDDMAELEKPLLVVLDDIDRLTVREICEVFQLVKANADFPNVTFLLVFDQSIVGEALDSVSGKRGTAFLEKIVQASFQVPRPPLRDVHQILCSRLDEILKEEDVAKRWNENLWRDVWPFGLRPYFSNLRRVYRFLNSLEFQVGQMRIGKTFELNPVDLIVLELFRLFEPSLYEMLAQSRSELVGEGADSISRILEKDDDTRKRVNEERERFLSCVHESRRDAARSLLETAFPVLFGTNPDHNEMQRNLRVGTAAYFDRYFTFSLHSSDVPQQDIDLLIETISSPQKFAEHCLALLRKGTLELAFERFDSYHSHLPTDDRSNIISSLADVADSFPQVDWFRTKVADPFLVAWRLIKFSLGEVKADARLQILLDGFSASQGVRLIVHVAVRQERREGNQGADYLVTEEEAASLRELALTHVRQAATQERLREVTGLNEVLWRWSEWEGQECDVKIWVDAQVISPQDALWFLKTIAGTMTAGAEIIRYVDLSHVERFAEIEKISALTCDLDLDSLEKEDKRALRAFRWAMKWKGEGKPPGYRGLNEANNPLAETEW